MSVKITCVYNEDSIEGTSLIGAKGTSMLVDVNGNKVLFDLGLRSRYLIHNLNYLGIDPNLIDAIVISQNHPDNCNALNGFLEVRDHPIRVYCPNNTYNIGYQLLRRGSIISRYNSQKVEFDNINCWTDIMPGITVTPMLGPDNGYKEIFLVVSSGESHMILSGRGSHGPADVLNAVFKRYGRGVNTFIGSILLEGTNKSVARKYLDTFFSYGCMDLYLNHCTGRDGIMNLRAISGLKKINDFYVGSVYCGKNLTQDIS